MQTHVSPIASIAAQAQNLVMCAKQNNDPSSSPSSPNLPGTYEDLVLLFNPLVNESWGELYITPAEPSETGASVILLVGEVLRRKLAKREDEIKSKLLQLPQRQTIQLFISSPEKSARHADLRQKIKGGTRIKAW